MKPIRKYSERPDYVLGKHLLQCKKYLYVFVILIRSFENVASPWSAPCCCRSHAAPHPPTKKSPAMTAGA